MPITLSSRVMRHAGVIDAEADNEIVALNVEEGTCFGLNRVGSRIWNLIESPMYVADICAILLREYNIDSTTCEQQVVEMLEGLRAERLVDECEPAA